VLICATAVGPVELLEIVDIKESVTYALSIPPIVGAPSIERFLLDGWETTNLGTATVWFSFLSVSKIHKSGLRSPHNKLPVILTLSAAKRKDLRLFFTHRNPPMLPDWRPTTHDPKVTWSIALFSAMRPRVRA